MSSLGAKRRVVVIALGSLALGVVVACSSFSATDTAGADAGPVPAEGSVPDGSSSADAADGSTSRYRDEVMKDNPVAYWRLGEASGADIAKDVLGVHDGLYAPPGHTLVLGAPGALANDPDTAITFDAGGHVVIGNFFDFADNVEFSIELWLKPSAIKDPSNYRRIISKEGPADGYDLQIAPDGRLGFSVYAKGGPNAEGGIVDSVYNSVADDTYVHVVAFYDRSSIQLYLNGVPVQTKAGVVTMLKRTDPFVIGGASYLVPQGDLRGSIDEVALYDKALSPARITAHYHAAGR